MILDDVEREFSIPVTTKEGYLDLTEFYDQPRRQYDGNRLLKEIDSVFASDSDKTLGVFNVDLFIPILSYLHLRTSLLKRTGRGCIHLPVGQ